MLTIFKVLSIKIKYKYCNIVAHHYFDKAGALVKKEDYEHADKYYEISARYLKKQFALMSELLEMA